MRRLLKIATREYISYIRTVGFWLSMCLMPILLGAGAAIPSMMDRSAPTRTLAIVDLTGHGLSGAIERVFAADAPPPGAKPGTYHQPVKVVPAPHEALAATPAAANAALSPYIAGLKLLPGGARLNAAAVLSAHGDQVDVDFWSGNLVDNSIQDKVGQAVQSAVRHERLLAAGVSLDTLNAIDDIAPRVTAFSPKAAAGGVVSVRDRLPTLAGFALGLMLWSVILTGAGILLNSVIEEKSTRILEVLLSSASTAEIMGGKILGVAGVAATVLATWATLAGTGLAIASPQLGADLLAVLFTHGLIAYFALYLACGYLMYASVFAAIGSFCETPREAQTLLGPVMVLMTIPMLFMSQAVTHPDAPVLQILSWIPPFTPFLMAVRVAGDPPLWQVVGTGALMIATTVAVVWTAGRAFHAGALSTGGIKAMFRRRKRG